MNVHVSLLVLVFALHLSIGRAQQTADPFANLPFAKADQSLFYSRLLTEQEQQELETSPPNWSLITVATQDNRRFETNGSLHLASGAVYLQSGQKIRCLIPEKVSCFQYKGFLFHQLQTHYNDQPQLRCAQQLVEGPMELYVLYQIADANASLSFEQQLQSASKYYLIKQHNTDQARYLPLQRSSVLKALHPHKSEVKKYLKEEGLSLNKEDDLVKLFRYYNRL
ncbi:MAG: hypothetical protein AAFV95_22445 [Bacteroidota bacterium]